MTVRALDQNQFSQLQAIASVAKGSGWFEGSNGGEGYMGAFTDRLTGQTRYIKMLTHSDERDDALDGGSKREMQYLADPRLRQMYEKLKQDLMALAETVGADKEVAALFEPKKGDPKNLMSRKIVAQAVSLIRNAHNKEVSESNGSANQIGQSLFKWKEIKNIKTDEDTTLGTVLHDVSCLKGFRDEEARKASLLRGSAVAGTDIREAEKALDSDIERFIGGEQNGAQIKEKLSKGILPDFLRKKIGKQSMGFDLSLNESVFCEKFIAKKISEKFAQVFVEKLGLEVRDAKMRELEKSRPSDESKLHPAPALKSKDSLDAAQKEYDEVGGFVKAVNKLGELSKLEESDKRNKAVREVLQSFVPSYSEVKKEWSRAVDEQYRAILDFEKLIVPKKGVKQNDAKERVQTATKDLLAKNGVLQDANRKLEEAQQELTRAQQQLGSKTQEQVSELKKSVTDAQLKVQNAQKTMATAKEDVLKAKEEVLKTVKEVAEIPKDAQPEARIAKVLETDAKLYKARIKYNSLRQQVNVAVGKYNANPQDMIAGLMSGVVQPKLGEAKENLNKAKDEYSQELQKLMFDKNVSADKTQVINKLSTSIIEETKVDAIKTAIKAFISTNGRVPNFDNEKDVASVEFALSNNRALDLGNKRDVAIAEFILSNNRVPNFADEEDVAKVNRIMGDNHAPDFGNEKDIHAIKQPIGKGGSEGANGSLKKTWTLGSYKDVPKAIGKLINEGALTTKRLDELMKQHGLSPIDFLPIDFQSPDLNEMLPSNGRSAQILLVTSAYIAARLNETPKDEIPQMIEKIKQELANGSYDGLGFGKMIANNKMIADNNPKDFARLLKEVMSGKQEFKTGLSSMNQIIYSESSKEKLPELETDDWKKLGFVARPISVLNDVDIQEQEKRINEKEAILLQFDKWVRGLESTPTHGKIAVNEFCQKQVSELLKGRPSDTDTMRLALTMFVATSRLMNNENLEKDNIYGDGSQREMFEARLEILRKINGKEGGRAVLGQIFRAVADKINWSDFDHVKRLDAVLDTISNNLGKLGDEMTNERLLGIVSGKDIKGKVSDDELGRRLLSAKTFGFEKDKELLPQGLYKGVDFSNMTEEEKWALARE